MKKLVIVFLVFVMGFSYTACDSNVDENMQNETEAGGRGEDNVEKDQSTESSETVEGTEINSGDEDVKVNDSNNEDIRVTKDANEILKSISEIVAEKYNEVAAEDESLVVREMTLIGGSNTDPLIGESKKFDFSQEGMKEEFSIRFCVPFDVIDMIDDASGVVDGVMASNFHASVIHVKNKANIKNIISGIEEAAQDTAWTCGGPEQKLIYVIGEEYLVTIFGTETSIREAKKAVNSLFGEEAVLMVEGGFY